MPIEEFKNCPPFGEKVNVREKVLAILEENDDKAFTSKELAQMIGKKDTTSINGAIKKLAEEGKVVRKRLGNAGVVALAQ